MTKERDYQVEISKSEYAGNSRGGHAIPLRYGRTDGENIPIMTAGNFFAVGYNPRFGLIDVTEDNGTPLFEGNVDIRSILPKILLEEGVPYPKRVNEYVSKRSKIMRLESELADSKTDKLSKLMVQGIESKIDQYKTELVADPDKVDSRVDQYIMESYRNWQDHKTNPGNYDSSPEPIMEVLTDNR